MLIAVEKPLATFFTEIQSSGNHPVFRKQAVIPFPEAFGRFPVKAAVFPDIKTVACRTTEGAGAAGQATASEVIPQGAVLKGLTTGAGVKNGSLDVTCLSGGGREFMFAKVR